MKVHIQLDIDQVARLDYEIDTTTGVKNHSIRSDTDINNYRSKLGDGEWEATKNAVELLDKLKEATEKIVSEHFGDG